MNKAIYFFLLLIFLLPISFSQKITFLGATEYTTCILLDKKEGICWGKVMPNSKTGGTLTLNFESNVAEIYFTNSGYLVKYENQNTFLSLFKPEFVKEKDKITIKFKEEKINFEKEISKFLVSQYGFCVLFKDNSAKCYKTLSEKIEEISGFSSLNGKINEVLFKEDTFCFYLTNGKLYCQDIEGKVKPSPSLNNLNLNLLSFYSPFFCYLEEKKGDLKCEDVIKDKSILLQTSLSPKTKKRIVVGYYYTCFLEEDNLLCYNLAEKFSYGKGIWEKEEKCILEEERPYFLPYLKEDEILSIAGGKFHVCALTKDNKIICKGCDAYGAGEVPSILSSKRIRWTTYRYNLMRTNYPYITLPDKVDLVLPNINERVYIPYYLLYAENKLFMFFKYPNASMIVLNTSSNKIIKKISFGKIYYTAIPTIYKDNLFLYFNNAYLASMNISTFSWNWIIKLSSRNTQPLINSSLSISNDTLYLINSNLLSAICIETGKVKWTYSLNRESSFLEDMLIIKDKIIVTYVNGTDYFLLSLSKENGEVIHNIKIPKITSFFSDGNSLFFIGEGYIFKLNEKKEIAWNFNSKINTSTIDTNYYGIPLEKEILFFDGDNIHFINKENGKETGNFALPFRYSVYVYRKVSILPVKNLIYILGWEYSEVLGETSYFLLTLDRKTKQILSYKRMLTLDYYKHISDIISDGKRLYFLLENRLHILEKDMFPPKVYSIYINKNIGKEKPLKFFAIITEMNFKQGSVIIKKEGMPYLRLKLYNDGLHGDNFNEDFLYATDAFSVEEGKYNVDLYLEDFLGHATYYRNITNFSVENKLLLYNLKINQTCEVVNLTFSTNTLAKCVISFLSEKYNYNQTKMEIGYNPKHTFTLKELKEGNYTINISCFSEEGYIAYKNFTFTFSCKKALPKGLKKGNECKYTWQCEGKSICSNSHCCPIGTYWDTDKNTCLPKRTLLFVGLKNRLKSAYNPDQIKKIENKIGEYFEVLEKEGISGNFYYLDMPETFYATRSYVYNTYDWKKIAASLRKLLKKENASYLIILGGYDRFPQYRMYGLASDDFYVDFDPRDNLPDIPVGRIVDPDYGDFDLILSTLDNFIRLHKEGGIRISTYFAKVMYNRSDPNEKWTSGVCLFKKLFNKKCTSSNNCKVFRRGNENKKDFCYIKEASNKNLFIVQLHGSPGIYYKQEWGCNEIEECPCAMLWNTEYTIDSDDLKQLNIKNSIWLTLPCFGGNIRLKHTTDWSLVNTFFKRGGAIYIGGVLPNMGALANITLECKVVIPIEISGTEPSFPEKSEKVKYIKIELEEIDRYVGSLYYRIAKRLKKGNTIGDAFLQGKLDYYFNVTEDPALYHEEQFHSIQLYGDPTLKIKSSVIS